MNIRTDEDLDKKVTYFGPHDGGCYPDVRLPVQLKELVDALNGKSMTLRTVTNLIANLAGNTPGEIIVGRASIMLLVGVPGKGEYIWKLISFRGP